MIFSSAIFLFVFLPLVLTVYLTLNESMRNVWLLAASLFFYYWACGIYVWVLITTILLNYLAGLGLGRLRPGHLRTGLFACAVLFNVLLLVYVKYASFLADSWNQAALRMGSTAQVNTALLLHVPLLGVSFFTFHCISYLADVYRGEVKAERSPLRAALYVAVFPQLLAGPIVLYRQISHQLGRRRFLPTEFEEGILRFVLGLSKKVLIADVLALPVDHFFALGPDAVSTAVGWLAVPLFALQVYYDFSGYSDMAVGLGLMFGFRFPENFAYPYAASSLAVFWTRWHMSLTNWFRSYLFFPLTQGGSGRSSALRIILIFGLIGLWHGASWTFLLFGLWNGLAYVGEIGLSRSAWYPKVSRLYLWFALWVGMALFRAPSFSFVVALLAAGLGVPGPDAMLDPVGARAYLSPQVLLTVLVALPCCTSLPWRLVQNWDRASSRRGQLAYGLCRFGFLGALFFLCAARIASSSYRSFIYFQF